MKKILILALLCVSLLSCEEQRAHTPDSGINISRPFVNVPDSRDVVIYQINPRAFSEEGSLKGITARLDSINALGVNVVYLMPIYPVGEERSVNSLYCIKNYTAVSEEFGTLEDLQELVSEAHNRDMAVLMDWVANHTSYDHPWTADKSWYLTDSTGSILSPPGTGWNDVAQLNFENYEMRKEMIDAMKYWVLNANIDGFRCDYSDGPPFDFWKQAIDTLNGLEGRKLLFLSEGTRNDHFTAGFHYNFGFNFFHTMSEKIYKNKASVKILKEVNEEEYQGSVTGNERVVRYTSNHDVNISDGTPLDLFVDKRGAMAAFVVAAYMKSVPMIYNGQEIGYDKRLEFFSRTPIDWNVADYDKVSDYKKLIGFYNKSKAIRRGEMKDISDDNLVAFIKEKEGEQVLVLSNIRDKEVLYNVPAELIGVEWQDVFSGEKLTLNDYLSVKNFKYMVLSRL